MRLCSVSGGLRPSRLHLIKLLNPPPSHCGFAWIHCALKQGLQHRLGVGVLLFGDQHRSQFVGGRRETGIQADGVAQTSFNLLALFITSLHHRQRGEIVLRQVILGVQLDRLSIPLPRLVPMPSAKLKEPHGFARLSVIWIRFKHCIQQRPRLFDSLDIGEKIRADCIRLSWRKNPHFVGRFINRRRGAR